MVDAIKQLGRWADWSAEFPKSPQHDILHTVIRHQENLDAEMLQRFGVEANENSDESYAVDAISLYRITHSGSELMNQYRKQVDDWHEIWTKQDGNVSRVPADVDTLPLERIQT